MAKDAYYFSHDSNAHKDPKILKLRAKHGWEGYGIYWAIIETLREQNDYKWLANDKQLLSFSFANGDEVVNQVIDTCLNVGLLVDDGEYIYSESLTKRMKLKDEISEKRRAAGKKGGSSKSQAIAKQNESNKKKVNEIKENEIKQKKINDDKADNSVPEALYEKLFSFPSAVLRDDFKRWIEDSQFQEPEAIICEVIKRSAVEKPRNPAKYLQTSVDRLLELGLFTLDAVKEYNEKFDQKNKKKKSVHDFPTERPSHWPEPEELTEEELRKMHEALENDPDLPY